MTVESVGINTPKLENDQKTTLCLISVFFSDLIRFCFMMVSFSTTAPRYSLSSFFFLAIVSFSSSHDGYTTTTTTTTTTTVTNNNNNNNNSKTLTEVAQLLSAKPSVTSRPVSVCEDLTVFFKSFCRKRLFDTHPNLTSRLIRPAVNTI